MMVTALRLALIGSIALFAAQNESSFESFLSEFTKTRNELQTLRATFTQTTITPDEEIVSTGTILYTNPKRILFRYDDPELHYLVDGLHAYEYDAELQQLQIFEMEDRPEVEALFLGFENNTKRLREAYRMRIVPAEPGQKGITLELQPKDPDSESAFFETLTLHLREPDFLPESIHIRNDAESSVLYAVGDFALNVSLDPNEARLFLPEGTVIIRNDEYQETVGPGGMYLPEDTPRAQPDSGTKDGEGAGEHGP